MSEKEPLKLMAILAHPDDESLGLGGILARYGAEGIATHLVTATRGQRGWAGDPAANPGPERLAEIRAEELQAAATILNLHEVILLDYSDGELDRAEPEEITKVLVGHLRRVRPQVVVTFDPFGSYGHPDHIAISQFAMAATVAAAAPGGQGQPHTVSKLYYFIEPEEEIAHYQSIFGELVMEIDDQERRATGWPRWAVTTIVDTEAYWPQIWQAISAHQSQLADYGRLQGLAPAEHARLWRRQRFYRAYSLVNGGRAVEDDLFAGLS
ncbi:MAG: PIG-L family deacetylase [Candidatus Promineifilaceae bacterium]|nr:PIG-L family deacetylase [Candidatus Promineifilaceae bacterium]